MSTTGKMFSSLLEQDTYVFIDVSNIRLACQKTLGFRIDFTKLLSYFRRKYPKLKDIRYYEGIARDDKKKQKMFNFLQRKGYTICPLERKSYNSVEIEEKVVQCPQCGNEWIVTFTKEHRALKSNVDVYLATELLDIAHSAKRPTHIILVSCDGDYAEAIKSALKNKNISISVLATPPVKDMACNTLSVRLRALRKDTPRYHLIDISNFKDSVSSQDN